MKASTKKVIVVVGGNGFFGSYLLENILLQNKFDEIRVFDIANTSLPSHPMIKFVKGSVTNLDDCLRALDGALAVLHIAAIVDVRYAGLDFLPTRSVSPSFRLQKWHDTRNPCCICFGPQFS